MKGLKLCLLAFAVFMAITRLSAQTYSTGREFVKAEVNLTDLVNYYKDHPMPLVRKPVIEEEEEDGDSRDRSDPSPSLVHRIHRSASKEIAPADIPYMPVSYDPIDTFLGTTTNGTSIPPDTHGAVDSNYSITAINTSVRIQRRTTPHSSVSYLDLDAFWSSILPSGTSGFDPRVHYDPYYNRWIIVTFAVASAAKNKSTILIGVSKTSNPTAGWNMYAISTDPTGKAWLDYPNVGFNNKWITVTGNFFQNSSGGQTGAVLYVFDYAQLRAGTGAAYTKISKSSSFTICPALTYDPAASTMFAVEKYSGSGGTIRLWKITGGVSSPVITSVGFPASGTTWRGSYSGGDFGPQSGISDKIDCGDDRITNLTYRNGKLWCSHNVFLPQSGTTKRCSIMWWIVDTLAKPIQNGLIDDPTSANFYVYPCLSVNQNEDFLIGFSHLSSLSHPNAGYAIHLNSDPKDSIRKPFLYRHGRNTYVQKFTGTKNRWGDYSASCVDPVNMNDFWTVQESVPNSANSWDTWWAYVKMCPATAAFTVSTHNSNINTDDNFVFTGTAPAGTTFSWNFGSGAIPPTSTSAGPIAVKWSTAGTKTITLTVTLGTCSTVFSDTVHVQNYGAVAKLKSEVPTATVVPNPNHGAFDILFGEQVSGDISVKLTDVQGREVYKNQFTTSNDNKISVATDNLPAGIYIASISIGGELITKKVTIEK